VKQYWVAEEGFPSREAIFIALPRKVDTMLLRFDAAHEHGKEMNEFAVHNRYTPLNFGIRQQELHGALTQMTVI
jgi:hypothetical protein